MDITKYEKFCQSSKYGNFMQSACWAKVKSNWLPEYAAVVDDENNIQGCALVLIRKIPILHTSMLYVPRGFVCDMHNKEVVEKILEQVKIIAKKYNAYTLKIDPMLREDDDVAIKNLTDLGFVHQAEKRGYDNIQCRENYILSIKNKSCYEVFNSFKSKHRYNIRLAQRKGVVCKFYGKEALDDFVDLMKQTGKRDGFNIRTKEYFAKILEAFDGKAKLCMCYLDDKALSGALMINYAGTTSYVYGCSSNEYRNYMPNYLMQWTMIEYAIKSNCNVYDFGGIPYWDNEQHKNYGVYRFKQGFNGNISIYTGEFDYTFKPIIQRCAGFAMKIKLLCRIIK